MVIYLGNISWLLFCEVHVLLVAMDYIKYIIAILHSYLLEDKIK